MKQIKTILSRLIGNENVLSNNVLFIDFTGSHEKAQLLSQMYYWSSRTKRKDGFFCKSYQEWFNEIRLKEHSVRRYVKQFKELGFLETKVCKFNGIPKLHYKINQDKLIEKLLTFCDSDNLHPLHGEGVDPCTESGSTLAKCQGPRTLAKCQGPLTEISIDYKHRLDTDKEIIKNENLKKEEKQKTKLKEPKIQTDWKPAATALLNETPEFLENQEYHIEARDQIKDQADVKNVKAIGECTKQYFLNLIKNEKFYLLKIPKTELQFVSWRAKHLAGITQWILNDRKFHPKKYLKPVSEPTPYYHKAM